MEKGNGGDEEKVQGTYGKMRGEKENAEKGDEQWDKESKSWRD